METGARRFDTWSPEYFLLRNPDLFAVELGARKIKFCSRTFDKRVPDNFLAKKKLRCLETTTLRSSNADVFVLPLVMCSPYKLFIRTWNWELVSVKKLKQFVPN